MTITNPTVAFSYDIFASQYAGGVSRCMIELMRGLDRMEFGWSFWTPKTANVMLRRELAEPWMTRRAALMDASSIGRLRSTLENEFRFAKWVERVRPKIVHRTYYPVLNLVHRGIKRVETLHDLWDERVADAGDKPAALRSFVKRRACERADAVVCVSEHTKIDAISRWPELEGRLHIIPHGVSPLSDSPNQVNVSRPYFLFVGRRGSYKNFDVAASALAHSALHDHLLICFGGGPLTTAETERLVALGVRDRVCQIAGSDDLLAGLYLNAVALLYPSSFEGFGMPILEAMLHRCPVIAAPLTSLPEVGGDAAIYANPRFPDEWAEKMINLAVDEELADSLRQMGSLRSVQFSWDKSALKHANLYNKLCS